MVSVGVIGSGAWGTTLAFLLANKGIATTLWEHRPPRAIAMQQQRENILLPTGDTLSRAPTSHTYHLRSSPGPGHAATRHTIAAHARKCTPARPPPRQRHLAGHSQQRHRDQQPHAHERDHRGRTSPRAAAYRRPQWPQHLARGGRKETYRRRRRPPTR